jgi:hypothetical protein
MNTTTQEPIKIEVILNENGNERIVPMRTYNEAIKYVENYVFENNKGEWTIKVTLPPKLMLHLWWLDANEVPLYEVDVPVEWEKTIKETIKEMDEYASQGKKWDKYTEIYI